MISTVVIFRNTSIRASLYEFWEEIIQPKISGGVNSEVQYLCRRNLVDYHVQYLYLSIKLYTFMYSEWERIQDSEDQIRKARVTVWKAPSSQPRTQETVHLSFWMSWNRWNILERIGFPCHMTFQKCLYHFLELISYMVFLLLKLIPNNIIRHPISKKGIQCL